jgi:D-alanyl-lipoteichoic acid acyltransferase DltB (MBOAT superfamily)
MPLNSYEFLFAFLPITVCGFWLLQGSGRRALALGWLLIASIAFYAYGNLMSLAIIAPSILLDYALATYMLRLPASRDRLRNAVFSLGVTLNVLFLGYFKYRGFFLDSLNAVFATRFEIAHIIFPLGISFLVFQKIAFLADVQAGEVRQISLVDHLLFMLFFPRTLAGPIVHYNEVLPQLTATRTRTPATHVVVGICLLSIGLFKKAVIADGVGNYAAALFDPPRNPDFADLPPTLLYSWAGVLCYAQQLYFDFSGYSDMALGAARMLGVRLPMNFNSPFKASNLVEFWSRWHITLTRFLTAYIYTPMVLSLTRARIAAGKDVLQGRKSTLRAIGALVAMPTLVTMALSGLWHGAGWQFVLWGLLHGIGLTATQTWRLLRPAGVAVSVARQRLTKSFSQGLTFAFVAIALVFFRSPSVGVAWTILCGMAGANGVLAHDMQTLESAGVPTPWSILELSMPIHPFLWIVTLLPIVTLMPNSLELLRRFQPALDFPPEQAGDAEIDIAGRGSPAPLLRGGMEIAPRTALLAALLFGLGVMALSHGGGFIYGQF